MDIDVHSSAKTSQDIADDSSIDDDLLLVAISLVKSAGDDAGHGHFAARVALVFEALRNAHRN